MREWTPNERRFVREFAARDRLLAGSLTLIVVAALLSIVAGGLILGPDLSPRVRIAVILVSIIIVVTLVLLSPLRSLLWSCFAGPGSPRVERIEGKLTFETVEVDGVEGQIPQVGLAQVYFPIGWLDYFTEGDSLQGDAYWMANSVSARRNGIYILLSLTNGFSVDREVSLGLMKVAGPAWWAAVVLISILWGLSAGSLALSDSWNEIPALYTLWIPAFLFLTILVLAATGSLRNRIVWPRIVEFRQQHASAPTSEP